MRIWGDKQERSVMPTSNGTPPEILADPGHREWLGERWRFEDERWDRYTVTTDFKEAVAHAGDAGSPTLRIYGAERLAEVARKRVPGGSVLWNPDGFPFYLAAARALGNLLALEEHPSVRRAIRTAVHTLIDFGSDGEQMLLYALIPVLTDANESCLRAFRDTLGRYVARYGTVDSPLPALAPLLELTDGPETTLACLQSLADDPDCRAVAERQNALRAAQAKFGEPSGSANNSLVETLCSLAARLTDSRDVLARALCEVQAPPLGVDSSQEEFARWRSVRKLALGGAFLAGARLSRAKLIGATLNRCSLEGANLTGANLVAAELKSARLTGAEVYGVELESVMLPEADLSDADWWNASPSSWRSSDGEALRRWMHDRYPRPLTELPEEAPKKPKKAAAEDDQTTVFVPPSMPSATPPLPLPVAPLPTADLTANSAAEKIAELKRRASGQRVNASESGRTDPRRKDPKPAAGKEARRPGLTLTSGKVVIRDKALPNDSDVISESDLLEVTDLMVENAAGNGVASHSSGRPSDDSLTEDDLLEITDLLRKPAANG